jgi:hypothetical protein
VLQWLKAIFTPRPPRPPVEVRSPDLGVLRGEDGLWNGRVFRHGRDIPFTVAGTADEPDAGLLDRLAAVLADFPALEASARQFLCPPDAPVTPDNFTFQAVSVLWPDRPDYFTLEFDLSGDPGSIWRVEFQDGQPKSTGRDS